MTDVTKYCFGALRSRKSIIGARGENPVSLEVWVLYVRGDWYV